MFFPTWNADGTAPTAIVAGTLVEENDCLFIDGNGVRTLVVWEEGMGYEGGALLDEGGAPIARLGEMIHGGGGYYSDRTHIERLTEETIPNRCVLDGPERFALIYDVTSGSPN